MSNLLVSELIDFDFLTTPSVGRVKDEFRKAISTQSMAPTFSQELSAMLHALMVIDPSSFDVLAIQARSLFERTMGELDALERGLIPALPIDAWSETKVSLHQIFRRSCFLARLKSIATLRRLNNQILLHDAVARTTEVPQSVSEMSFEILIAFYTRMVDVKMSVAAAAEAASALHAHAAVRDWNLKSEEFLAEITNQEVELSQIQFTLQALGNMKSSEERTPSPFRTNFYRSQQNNHDVVVYGIEEHEILQQRQGELQASLRELTRELKAINKVNEAISQNLPDEKLLEIMLRAETLRNVAQRWKDTVKAKAKLQKSIEAGQTIVQQKAKLHSLGRYYTTDDVAKRVEELTKISWSTNDVVYRLDKMVEQKFIAPNDPGRHWELTFEDYEAACEYMCLVARKKKKRKPRQSSKKNATEAEI